MIPAVDISKYQGAWQDYPADIVMIKMSGGDNGLYMDSDASTNYNSAVAAGKAVGGYHFAGNTNPASEATYFMQAMSPLAENDVYALDWELPVGTPGAVEWCQTFVQTVHDKIGVWPLIYMNLNTLNSYDWSPVLANCGLWLADWNNDPQSTISTVHTYVMQQYSDGPNYDHDEWFGTIEEFKAYGYHAPQPVTTPSPALSTPVSEPVAPTATPTPTPSETSPASTANTPSSTSSTENTTTQSTTVSSSSLKTATPIKPHWYDIIIKLIRWIFS